MDTLRIDLASEADLDALTELAVEFRNSLEQEDPAPGEFRRYFALLMEDPSAEFFVARAGSRGCVGYIQCRYRLSAWKTGFEAELEDVFVAAGARRRGVGRQLIEFAVARATARGCRSLGLNTNEHNAPALSLYTGTGFRAKRKRWGGGKQLWLERDLPHA